MSLLKSFQNIPGVITLFHIPQNNNSLEILKLLSKKQVSDKPVKETWFSKILKSDTKELDHKTAALDKILNSNNDGNASVNISNDSKNVNYYIDIQTKFPTLQQYRSLKQYSQSNSVNELAFNSFFPKDLDEKSLKDLTSKPLNELPHIFKNPLLVDWSKGQLGISVKDAEKMLAKYL